MNIHHNILFVYWGPLDAQRSGVARVNNILSENFIRDGHKVYGLAMEDGPNNYSQAFVFPAPLSNITENSKFIQRVVLEKAIDVIILSTPSCHEMAAVVKPLKGQCKIIGHMHNSPIALYSLFDPLKTNLISTKSWFRKITFIIQKKRYQSNIDGMMEMVDKMILLSEKYISELQRLTKVGREKIEVIYNPFKPVSPDINKKRKQIVYVGRIENGQKRIKTLLDIWKKVYKKIPDWNLVIVGGGEQLKQWEEYAVHLEMSNYSFMGYQIPDDFYNESSIFVMTSTYEGFPMSMVEAMQYGCVPIAFDSFAAINDIIDNDTGIIIPAFNERMFCRELLLLTENADVLYLKSKNCMEKAKLFQIDSIYVKWSNLLMRLCD